MKYPGSKNRIGHEISQFIRCENPQAINWVEPFVGGCNMIDKIPSQFNRIGFDNNKYLISMFNAIKNGWIPPDNISEQEYKDIKKNVNEYPDCLVGFVGIGCSFAGKWFGGYARGGIRNYCLESKRNLLKQKQNIQDVQLFYGDYSEIILPLLEPNRTIIYCDPPYANTTKYSSNFDSDKFWEWCNKMVKNGYKVYVSEYNAPENWKCIWQKEVISSLDLNTGNKRAVEKLFKLKQPHHTA